MTPESEPFARALADRYLLEREVGAGGSATVYLARDVRHRRPVAVKVLHRELAKAFGPERFLREIETTANLRHPNILPLYDSGEAAGFLFYVMPFLDGESLRHRLERDRQLPLDEALRLAREIADALAYAHELGVIHRDIKPENVMLDRGHAVVADFGIARALSVAGSERITNTGMSLGTPLYMSPEQAFGEADLDARSDQYSLACVVYEMLAGDAPFTGPTAMAILMRHLKDPPPPLGAKRADIPANVTLAVERALAKAPADRFPTVTEWLAALVTPAAPAAHTTLALSTTPATASASALTPEPRVQRDSQSRELTIAVEAFGSTGAITGGGVEPSAIADGLADDIGVGLSQFPYLTVVRGDVVAPDYLLQGRVRLSGSTLRVTVQVVNRATREQLWGETYDRTLAGADVFAVMDDVTDHVVATVADPYGVLVRAITTSASVKPVVELTPYEAVLLYYHFHQRPAPDTHLTARAALERAVEQQPRNADAWASLTFLYLDEDRHAFNPRPDPLPRALAAARKAVDSDPTSANAHHALAEAHFFLGDRGGFRAAAERAVALNRHDGATVAMLGNLLACTGEWERGVSLARDAMSLNPHHPGWYRFGAFFEQYNRGAYAEALETAERINMPGYFMAVMVLLVTHAQLGHTDAVRATREELLALFPTVATDGVGVVEKWLHWQPELLERFISGMELAGVHVALPQAPGYLSR